MSSCTCISDNKSLRPKSIHNSEHFNPRQLHPIMALLCNYSVVDYCTVYTTLDYNAALEGKQSKGI